MKKGIAVLLGIALLGTLFMVARALDKQTPPTSHEDISVQATQQATTAPPHIPTETETKMNLVETEATEPIILPNRVQLLVAAQENASTLNPTRFSKTIEGMTAKKNLGSLCYLGFRDNYMYFLSNFSLYKMDISNEKIIKLISSMELRSVRAAVRETYQDASVRATGIAFYNDKIVLTISRDCPTDSPEFAEGGFTGAVVLINEQTYRVVDTKIFTGSITPSNVALYKDIAIIGTNDNLTAYKITNKGLVDIEFNLPAPTESVEYHGLYVDEASNLLAVSKNQQGVAVYDIKYDENTPFTLTLKDDLKFPEMHEFGTANSEGYFAGNPVIKDGYVVSPLAHEKKDGQSTDYKGLIIAPIGNMQTDCEIFDISSIYTSDGNIENPGPVYLGQDSESDLLCTNMGPNGICLWKWNGDGTVSLGGTIKPEDENLSSLYCVFHNGELFEIRHDLSTDSFTNSISINRIRLNTQQ